MNKSKLNINEIFASINGEANKWGQGSPTVFIRLQGCNLDCQYSCDTKLAKSISDNKLMTQNEIIEAVKLYGIKRVTITGGEPLLQPQVFNLIDNLLSRRYQVSVETNGSLLISGFYFHLNDLNWIIDYKLHYANKMLLQNYTHLSHEDWIKIVIGSPEEFYRAIFVKKELQDQGCFAKFAFSPVNADPKLANEITHWLIKNKISDVNLSIQIQKIISVK